MDTIPPQADAPASGIESAIIEDSGEQSGGEYADGGIIDGASPGHNTQIDEEPDGQSAEDEPAEEAPAEPQGMPMGISAFSLGGDIIASAVGDCVPLDKSFPLTVQIKWNDSTAEFRPGTGDIPFKVYGESTELSVGAITASTSGNTITYTIADVPVYILEGTDGSGSATYTTPSGFYTVRLKADSIPGYTISGGTVDTDGNIVVAVGLVLDVNILDWTAVADPFTCTLSDLTSAVVEINWIDNNDKAGVRPLITAIGGLIELYYKTAGGEYEQITSANCKELGFLSDMVPSPEVTQPTVGVWRCEFANLPKEIGGAAAEYYVKLADNQNIKDNYLTAYSHGGYSKSGGQITLTYTSVFSGSLVWHDKEYPDHSPRPVDSDINLKVYLVGGQAVPQSDYTLVWTPGSNGTWTYAITGLSMYDSGGKQNIYYTQIDSDRIGVASGFSTVAGAYYSVAYDNKTISAEKDKCYSGGEISAVLKANASFAATKIWLDDASDSAATPAAKDAAIAAREAAIGKGIKVYLWRYPSNTKSEPVVAAVTENGTQLSFTLDASFKDDSKAFSFADFNPQSPLPMFDEKGYKFIYFATEVMAEDSGYRAVYAESLTGQTTDALYNGGVLKNVRSEQVRIQTTKRWDVQGVNDYRSAQITLKLRAYENGEWRPMQYTEDGSVAEEQLSGFTTTVKSKTITFDAVEKYDDNGKAHEIRVVESIAGVDSFGTYEKVGASYEAVYLYKGHSYKTTSTQNVDGSWTVINSLWGTIDYSIEKIWSGDAPHSEITIRLLQDKVHYATLNVTEDGVGSGNYIYTITPEGTNKLYDINGDQKSSIGGSITFADNTWPFDVVKLPAYDDNGKAYVYSVSENTISNIWTRYNYSDKVWDADAGCYKVKATVINYTTTGPGSYIRIAKEWEDDNNLAQREAATVQMVLAEADGTYSELALSDLKLDSALLLDPTITSDSDLVDKFTIKLSEGNNWIGYIDYNPADFEEPLKLAIIEAKVGDRPSVPEGNKWNVGTIPAVMDAGSIKIGYTYIILGAVGSGNFTIINKPVGAVSVTVKKAWQDSKNYSGYRLDKFRIELYQNGTTLYGTKDWTTDGTLNEYPEHTFSGLPMFDADGIPYAYSVKEYIVDSSNNPIEILLTDTAATTKTNYISSMEETSVETIVGDMFTQQSTFSFTNTATAKKEYVDFYVVWRDEYNMPQRPDASYTLYYRIGDTGEIKPYTGDYRMITQSAEAAGSGNPYYQKITYSGMEEFDENGELYHYFIGQTLVNDELYTATYYKNTDSTDIVEAVAVKNGGGIHHYKPASGAVPLAETKIPQGGAIVNTIYDEITISGSKLWMNLDKGLSDDPDALPEALIYLWRDSNYDTAKKLPSDLATNPSGVSNALEHTTLTDEKDGYRFADAQGLIPYAKYDEYGALYTYELSERIVYSTAITGGQTIDFPMEIMSAGVTTIALTNTYLNGDTNSRSITVNKEWEIDGIAVPNPHPAARFLLYRLAVLPNFSGNPSHPERVDVSSYSALPAGAVQIGEAVYTSPDTPNAPITWTRLPIYAPNGKVYVYFVCEDMSYVPGYEATIDVVVDGSKGSREITGVSDTLRIAVIGNNALEVAQNDAVNTNTVKFTNIYNSAVLAKITGTKTWIDNDNNEGVRPGISGGVCDDIILTLKRTASTQTIQDNEDEHPYLNTEIEIVWASTDINTWSYTITPASGESFPLYSENGNPYKYTVIESYKSDSILEKNYKIMSSLASAAVPSGTASGADLSLTPSLRNQLKGTINVAKIWADGYNNYEIRENSVTVQLQRRLNVSDLWVDAPVPSINLVPTNWGGSFQTLPLTDSSGVPYLYRVVETKIGNTVVAVDETNTAESINYDVTHSGTLTISPAGTANATIRNALTSTTKLIVTKTWADSNDQYKARPSSINLKLEWKFVTGSLWDTLFKVDGATPVTKIMDSANASGNVWTTTFENLPKQRMDGATLKDVQYRAVEMDGNTALTVIGGKAVLDSYEMTPQVDDYAGGVSTTAITNTLIERADITIRKMWNDTADHSTDSIILELYSDNFDANKTANTKIIDSTGTNQKTLNNSNSFTAIWSALPKYNPDQEEIIYYVKEVSVNGSAIASTTGGSAIKGNTADNRYHVNYYVENSLVTTDSARVTNDVATGITVVNTPLIEAKVQKIWEDDGDKFDLRPSSIEVTLQRKLEGESDTAWANVTKNQVSETTGISGAADITLTLNSGNLWKGSVKNLPAYQTAEFGGTAYEYRFVETVPAGYSAAATTLNNETTITNTLILSDVEYQVEKIWQDTDNQDGIRPPSITVELLHKVGPVYVSYNFPITEELNEGNSWSWDIGTLPKMDSYKIKELSSPGLPTGYTALIAPATFEGSAAADVIITVTNTHIPGTLDYTITKTWAGDSATALDTRPAIELTLYRTYLDENSVSKKEPVSQNQSGTLITNPVVIGADLISTTAGVIISGQDYSYEWSNLPQYIRVGSGSAAVSRAIAYSVEETACAGYSLDGYTGVPVTGSNATTITNTLNTTSWIVEKTWVDYPGLNTRPAQIEFTLYRQEGPSGTVETVTTEEVASATSGTAQTHTFANLPTHSKAGIAYIYSAKETRVYTGGAWIAVDDPANAYETQIAQVVGGTNVTNTWKSLGEAITISGSKIWDDSGDLFDTRPRPEDLILTVYYLDGASWIQCGDAPGDYQVEWLNTNGDTWTYTIKSFPKRDGNGIPYVYAVRETVPSRYARITAEYQTGTVEGNGNIIGVAITNRLDPIARPLVVDKTVDRGPNTILFSFQVMLSADPITDHNPGKLYKGAYKVFTQAANITTDTVLRSGTATDGTISIMHIEKFVIEGIPDGYYYQIIELEHDDYDLDPSSANMSGQLSAVSVTNAEVKNKARIELEIKNDTANPAGQNGHGIGGNVVVIENLGDAPSYNDSDSGYDRLTVAWKPDTNWMLGSFITINYTDFDSSSETSICIQDFSISEGVTFDLKDLDFVSQADKDALLAKYPNASITMSGGIVTLTLESTVADMPRKTQVVIDFLPILAIDNVTPDDEGGKVQVQDGTENADSDGVPSGGGPLYNATIVYGTAAAGYCLDMTQIQLRDIDGTAAPLSIAANGAFTATLTTMINGVSTPVTITGTATLTRDAAGNVTAAKFELDTLPIPLQFDVLFIPVPPIPSDDGGSGSGSVLGGVVGDVISPVKDALPPPIREWISWPAADRSGSPQTGDATPLFAVIALALASGVGILLLRKKPDGRKK